MFIYRYMYLVINVKCKTVLAGIALKCLKTCCKQSVWEVYHPYFRDVKTEVQRSKGINLGEA